jgi:hypothetical protein
LSAQVGIGDGEQAVKRDVKGFNWLAFLNQDFTGRDLFFVTIGDQPLNIGVI